MKTRADRFWAKVHKGEDCWEWTASLLDEGYGQFWDYRCIQAHRYSWILHNGPIPKGLWVLHRCDNRKCVRPDHLFIGTRQENMDDMVAKGRSASRTKNAMARLTEEAINDIRQRQQSSRELAEKYGVHPAHIRNIWRGKRWRDSQREKKEEVK